MCFHFCFASLVGIPIGITSSAVRSKICVITAEMESINQELNKKKKKHDKNGIVSKI